MSIRLSQFALSAALTVFLFVPRASAHAEGFAIVQSVVDVVGAAVRITEVSWYQVEHIEQTRLQYAADIDELADEVVEHDGSTVQSVEAVFESSKDSIGGEDGVPAVVEDVVVVDVEELVEDDENEAPSADSSTGTSERSSKAKKSGTQGSAKTSDEPTQVEEKAEAQEISVTLSASSPVGGSYSVVVDAGATVEAVMEAARSQGFVYSTKGFGGMGRYVESIGGVSEDVGSGMYWILLVNGAKSIVGISAAKVNDGDSISWSYERGF